MNRRDWNFVIGLMSATCVVLVWDMRGGVITIDQAGATARTIAMLCLAWLFLDSVQ